MQQLPLEDPLLRSDSCPWANNSGSSILGSGHHNRNSCSGVTLPGSDIWLASNWRDLPEPDASSLFWPSHYPNSLGGTRTLNIWVKRSWFRTRIAWHLLKPQQFQDTIFISDLAAGLSLLPSWIFAKEIDGIHLDLFLALSSFFHLLLNLWNKNSLFHHFQATLFVSASYSLLPFP